MANENEEVRIKDLTKEKYTGYAALDDELGTGKFPIGNIIDSIAPVFDATVDYTAGQSVMFHGKLYTFNVDHPAGSWDASHVDATNIKNVSNKDVSFLVNYTGARREVLSVTKGKFIAYGVFFDNAAFGYTDPVEIKSGEYVTIDCKAADVAMAVMSKYENGVYSNLRVSSDPTYKTYTWHNTTGASVNVVFSFQLDNAPFYYYAYNDKIQDHFSTVESNVEENEERIERIEDVFHSSQRNSISFADVGKFVGYGGTYNSNALFSISSPIELKPNETLIVKCNGYADYVEVFAFYDAGAGTYSNCVRGVDDSVREYSYTNKTLETEIIVVSCINASAPSVYYSAIISDRYNFADVRNDYKMVETAYKSNYLITKYGYEYGAAGSCYTTDPVVVPPGYCIEVKTAAAYNSDDVAIFSEKRIQSDIPYRRLVTSIDNTERIYRYKNETLAPKEIYVSFGTMKPSRIFVYKFTDNITEEYLASFSSFSSFGVVGDSYCAGHLCKSDNTIVIRPEYSWGKVLGRISGVDCTLFAESGATTRSAFTRVGIIPALLADTPKDVYFVCFGINDFNVAGYLGTAEDMDTEDYTQSADTFYGNYYKLIKTIQSHAPSALVFMIKPFNFIEADHSSFNEACDTIAETAGISCFNDFALRDVPAFSSMVDSHPTIIGYSCMAKYHKIIIEKWMQINSCNKLFDDTL